jgi:hypothetical protein
MLIAIAILSIIGYVMSFISNLVDEKCDVNLIMATILVISWWTISLPFAIIMICVTVIIGIISLCITK